MADDTPGNAVLESAPTTGEKTPPILCLGMARTGTASLAEALRLLGYPNIHHGLNMGLEDPEWEALERAADASFPTLPSYTGKPFARADWDEVFGKYDAVTDVASFYAVPLIAAYPDAKVIIVEREIESWYRSWVMQANMWATPISARMIPALDRMSGLRSGTTSAKFQKGWIGSNRRRDVYDKAREAYARHYAYIRKTVPPEQLLDFKLQDGWGPLCAFLDKDVPVDVAFPRVNDAKAYQDRFKVVRKEGMKLVGQRVLSRKRRAAQ